ncbi:MAG TPA: helix-turn-helix domain-containing protein [Azospirillum sp.]|nr:helix-turn-helix domain-containing protein [Azospirillum sp.]
MVASLKRKGSSLRQIAAELEVCAQAVSQALFLPSERIERALADRLEVAVHDLFPERYRPDGVRLCRTRGGAEERAAA